MVRALKDRSPQPNMANPSDNFGCPRNKLSFVRSLSSLSTKPLTFTRTYQRVEELLPSVWASISLFLCRIESNIYPLPPAPKKKAQKISLNEFLGDSGEYLAKLPKYRYWNVSAQR